MPLPALPQLSVDHLSLPGQLSHVVTVADNATLGHLLRKGIRENTMPATRCDLGYLGARYLASNGETLTWPPKSEVAQKFIAQHLWDPDERAINLGHGMPDHVRAMLKHGRYLGTRGTHAPSTIKRRIARWRALCEWRSVEHPFSKIEVSRKIREAIRASSKSRLFKSKRAVGTELIEDLLDILCLESERGAAEDETRRLHGRCRSEISNLILGQILALDLILSNSRLWPDGIPSMGLSRGRTKTTDTVGDATVFLVGPCSRRSHGMDNRGLRPHGPVFLRVNQWVRCTTHQSPRSPSMRGSRSSCPCSDTIRRSFQRVVSVQATSPRR